MFKLANVWYTLKLLLNQETLVQIMAFKN